MFQPIRHPQAKLLQKRERERGKIHIKRGLVTKKKIRKAELILKEASLIGNTILMKSMTISNVVLSHINHKHLLLE